VAAEEFHKLTGDREDFKDFLLSIPDLGELEVERDDRVRSVEL